MENKLKASFSVPLETKWITEADDKLLACMASGSSEDCRQAFDVFYRRHADFLFGICYDWANRYKFGFFDEEDVFQKTMMKAREHAHSFRPDGITNAEDLVDAVDNWLCGIAKRVVFDLIRRKPKCICLDPILLDGEANESEPDETFAQANHCPMDETEENKRIRAAVDALPPREKEVIWATSQFYVRRQHQRTPTEELDEIVKSLGITRDNFRKLKQRAKQKISKFVTNQKPIPEAK